MTDKTRACVLVLGMHRSGTSALTRLVSLMGVGLPKHVMPATGSNEAGFWEPKALASLHDKMLVEAGSAWNDWRAFDPTTALKPERLVFYRAEIKRLIGEEFGELPVFVFKDPRVSRFAPLYLQWLAELGIAAKIVLMLRHPLEVAASLAARDRMPESDAALLWLRHNLDAEAATRGEDRLVVSFDAAMSDPDETMARLRNLLGSYAPVAPTEAEIARGSLRPELRHHRGADFAAMTAWRDWSEAAYTALTAMERMAPTHETIDELDRLRAELDAETARRGVDRGYPLSELQRAVDEKYDFMGRLIDAETAFAHYRRRRIVDLAGLKRELGPIELPKKLKPKWTLDSGKREKARALRADYLAILSSPLFDGDYYLKHYPDVAEKGFAPAMHYLMHGSDEGRWPSDGVDPIDCKKLFPQLAEGGGNLVLRLIALARAKSEA